MKITLPRSIFFFTSDKYFPSRKPLFKASPIKDGIMIFNLKGELMGQVFADDDSVRVTPANGQSIVITGSEGKNVQFKKLVYKEEYKEENEEDSYDLTLVKEFKDNRAPYRQFDFFGNYLKGEYEIYEVVKNKEYPVPYFRVVDNPEKKHLADIDVYGEGNILTAVLIFYGISFLAFKK
ncbi:MAG: hypothetical protein K5765_03610 [Clostridia bacterium]|nr:hypothetical protein [Clostridia bacterium]